MSGGSPDQIVDFFQPPRRNLAGLGVIADIDRGERVMRVQETGAIQPEPDPEIPVHDVLQIPVYTTHGIKGCPSHETGGLGDDVRPVEQV